MQAHVDILIDKRLSDDAWETLERAQRDLDGIENRLQHVANLHNELEIATRKKPFVIYALPHWSAAAALTDMVIVDLASWLKRLWIDGGLLRLVCAKNELAAFARSWNWTKGAGDDRIMLAGVHTDAERAATIESIRSSLVAEQKRIRDQRFRNIFPNAFDAGRDVPIVGDVDALVSRLGDQFDPVIGDRNQNRAHRFEEQEATADRLSPQQAAAHLAECQYLFNDLRMLCSQSEYAARGIHVERSRWAQDHVDLILFGEINELTLDMAHHRDLVGAAEGRYWQWREAYYAKLHDEHDRRGGEEPFNARNVIHAYRNRAPATEVRP